MANSSIHFEKTDASFAKKHNSRKEEPTYLLDKKYWQGNDFEEVLSKEQLRSLYIAECEIRKQNKSRGSTPTLKNSQTEAVINLNKIHTIEDVKRVAEQISIRYGFTPVSYAVHRDEGHMEERDGKEFPVYNYHAHVVFFTMKNGISQRRKLGARELEEINTLTAKLLGMTRGESKTQRWERVAGMLGVSVEEIRRKDKSEAPNDYIKRIAELAKRKGFENFNIYEEVKPKKRLSAKEFRQVAKEKSEIVKGAKLAVLEQVQPVLQRSVEEKKQLHGTVKQLTNKVLTLKAQKAIVEAERKKYKDEGEHIASEYRKLQALNQTLHTQEELDNALADLRQEYEARLALKPKEVVKEVIKTVEKIVEKPIQVKVPVETVKEIIVPRQLTDSEIEELPRVKDLNNRLKKQSNELSAVLEVIQAMYLDFNIKNPIQSLKKIYNDWKNRTQKSSVIAPKLSQNDESTPERVEVLNNTQSQPMMSVEQKTTEEIKYRIMFGDSECFMTAQEIHDWLESYPEDRNTIADQLSEEDRAEVFPSPEQTDKLHGTVKPTQTTSFLRS